MDMRKVASGSNRGRSDEDITPFPVAPDRYDQKNEMFKRPVWDEKVRKMGEQFYENILFRDKVGYRKEDFAFRNAAWSVERSVGMGNVRSNSGLYSWDGVPTQIKRLVDKAGKIGISPEEASRMVKTVARFVGADLVGICKVEPNWIYSHEYDLLDRESRTVELPSQCKYAVVMAIAMDYEAIACSPSCVEGAAVGLGYSKMSMVSHMVATFLRGMGYTAIPCGNDTALSIPLAMAAGLGECGRMGLLITEKFGPRVRLCKVFTDLPLDCDSYRPFGVEEFCRTCKKCAIHCPSQAIPYGEKTSEGPSVSNQSGVLKWYINPERCFEFWGKNGVECSTCNRVCPYNKPAGILHDFVRAVSRRTPALNRFFVWMDTLAGYGRQKLSSKFWESR